VVVINLPQYVASAEDPGTAQAYLASLLGSGITLDRRFSELTEDEADEVARWLDEHLDEAALLRWAGNNEQRLALLRQVAVTGEEQDEGEASGDVQRALAALEALESIGPDVAEAIAAVADGDRESKIELFWALTDDDEGRVAAGQLLSTRLDERLDDARRAADAFDELLRTSGETAVQHFLEARPWLLGLDYARVRPRQTIVRGAIDFLLERFDDFHDLLELKSPDDPLFEVVGREADIRSPVSLPPQQAAVARACTGARLSRHPEP